MKKSLYIVTALLFVLLIGVWGYKSVATYGQNLDTESKDWVDRVTVEIISSWDSEKAYQNSSAALLKVSSREDFENIFKQLAAELGNFTEYKGAEGEAGIHINDGVKTITAEYIAEATFSKGSAKIAIRGIQEKGEWKILNFYVTPRGEQ